MKQHLKKTLRNVSPGAADWLAAWQFRRRCRHRYGDFQKRLSRALYPDGDIRVLSGPFEGMAYFNEIVWGPITPKWLGSYEEELHGIFFDEILTRDYGTIVDVGAAEGYYAVGLARTHPRAVVHAFDIDPHARKLQRRLAGRNESKNIRINRRCTHAHLNQLLGEGGLVICDIEGFEYALLDPSRAPSLRKCDILVELHDSGVIPADRVLEELSGRFAATHQTVVVKSGERDAARYEEICGSAISREDLIEALDEGRNGFQHWLWLKCAHLG